MQERERGRGDASDPRRERPDEDAYRSGSPSRSLTATPQDRGDWSTQDAGGWSGYVVPYRYYGPGYRGVGYYTVLYQGGGDSEADETRAPYGERGRQEAGVPDRDARTGPMWNDRAPRGFAGRGPKGYQRSDDRLREEVSDRLMADDQLDASDIEVQVQGGEVTLTGTVADRQAKRRAEDCAEQVMGVRDVMNQIRVQGRAGDREAVPGEAGSARVQAPSEERGGGQDRSSDDDASGADGHREATAAR
jgi:osmotically-inducible protein OsmY